MVSSTYRNASFIWEGVALQLLWPGDAIIAHQTFATLFGSLTEGPAGLLHFPLHTFGGVHHAYKEADVHGAHRLHNGVEEGHLHRGLPLTGVSQEVRGDGLVVGQVLAYRYGDGLADPPAAAHAVLGQETGPQVSPGICSLRSPAMDQERTDSPPCRTPW